MPQTTTPRLVFVTGGVVSSLGKGIATASLGALLKARGLRVATMKLDPYINVDAGTMSPYQHGEVFVTSDGGETDLDLGHYERFVGRPLGKRHNVTAGRIYMDVISRERAGDYNGATVQIIPHITDAIQSAIRGAAEDNDVLLVEVGGSVGDIESLPFLEAIRQLAIGGNVRSLFVHLTLVPYIGKAGESKTKPTQHSVRDLRGIGIQPDILICRTERPLSDELRGKIAMFTNVRQEAVIVSRDVDSIYKVPAMLQQQQLDTIVCRLLAINTDATADISDWHAFTRRLDSCTARLTVAVVGKYTALPDAYLSINEALIHAGVSVGVAVDVQYLDAQCYADGKTPLPDGVDAIIVPGGFGKRGFEGKVNVVQHARCNNVPFLGICLGLQAAVVEYARHVVGLAHANSTEFAADTAHPVIALVTEWQDAAGRIERRHQHVQRGGTLRLGEQTCLLTPQSKTHAAYGATDRIDERHRHRYEVNDGYVARLEAAGMIVAGRSVDGKLVEIIELPEHPWFVATQFHPEFASTPQRPHPLFVGLLNAALQCRARRNKE